MHTLSNNIAYPKFVHHSTHRLKNQSFTVFIVYQVLFDNLDIHSETMPVFTQGMHAQIVYTRV